MRYEKQITKREETLSTNSKKTIKGVNQCLKQQHQNKQKLLSQNYPTGSPEMDGSLITVS
jgi:hypothetical protein